jgi:ribose transport system permease protein
MEAKHMNDAPQGNPRPGRSYVGRLWHSGRHLLPVLTLLILIFSVFAITNPVFLSAGNLQLLLTSNAQLWVVAMGMTFVMIAGAVDLSVGAIMAFLAIMFGMLLRGGVSGGLALAITIAAGALLGGGVNGILIGRLGLSFLLVTLASLTALTGLVNLWSDTMAIPVQASITDSIAFGNFLGVNISMWIMGVTFVLAQLLQSRTYFGRDVYAVGGNRQAARLAGINSERTIAFVFGLTGIASALAAVIGIGRSGAASPTIDNNVPLEAIAAVLLGGTRITGGSGGVGGTALGVLFLATLGNGLSLSDISSYWQQIVTGVILVSAVLFNRLGADGGLKRWLGHMRRRHADAAPV